MFLDVDMDMDIHKDIPLILFLRAKVKYYQLTNKHHKLILFVFFYNHLNKIFK